MGGTEHRSGKWHPREEKASLFSWLRTAGIAAILLGGFGVFLEPHYFWIAALLLHLGLGLLIIDLWKQRDLQIISKVLASLFCLAILVSFNAFITFPGVPLAADGVLYTAQYPSNTKLGNIQWSSRYSELRVFLKNPTEYDYENINVIVQPDKPVVAVTQITPVEGVSEEANAPSNHMEKIQLPSGGSTVIPLILVATNSGYRIRCSKLSPKQHIELLFAIADVDMEATPTTAAVDDINYILQVTMSDRTSNWFGHGIYDELYQTTRPVVKEVSIQGEFIAAHRNRTVSQKIVPQTLSVIIQR